MKVMWTVLGIGGTCMIAFTGWLAQRSIAHDAQIAAMQYQLQSVIQINTNTISPVVEASLRELREKTNTDRELIAKLTEIATGNSKDIGYLREEMTRK